MSREIKFRAWDKEHNSMSEVFEFHIEMAQVKLRLKTGFGTERYLQFVKNVELMQFTGIFDKNGKEIYEGDVLDITSELFTDFGRTPTGKYDTTYKLVKWIEDSWGYKILRSKSRVVGNEHKILTVSAKWGEIIGNIYENPEFLEVVRGGLSR